jgi:membrane protease YdiL (CAAX protease family)
VTRLRTDDRVVVALAAGIAVLITANLVTHLVAASWSDYVVLVAGVAVVAVGRWGGLSAAELGLSRAAAHRGLVLGAVAVLVVVAVVVVAAVLPVTQDAFKDERYDDGFGAALLTAFVAVPLLTAIPEELAFRGVLLGLLSRLLPLPGAVAVSSLLFGLWHVGASWGLADDNAAVDASGGRLLAVVGTVVVTTGAGALLCWLRLRSGSLIAPVLAHWAVNGASALAAAWVWSAT